MKKTLLLITLAGASATANAFWLPSPEVVGETPGQGKTTIEWTYDAAGEKYTGFQVIVYKKHVATESENFLLAGSDFSHIESTGKQYSHEERGALWDYLPDCPGWWVKFPLYMKNALGIDTFQYFAGSDNSDIFGGAYIVSPDYDLSNLTNKKLNVLAELGNEATSVTGGFAIWAWNTNWMDEKNIDYKPVFDLDFHYDGLSNSSWKVVDETCAFPLAENYLDPDDLDEVNGICHDRARVMFYGYGKSAYWINSFEVSVDLEAGESIDYGASIHNLDADARSFEIDTTGDTATDYVYACEVRAIREDYDDFRELTTVRAINYPYNTPRHILGAVAGIDKVAVDGAETVGISTREGMILVSGAATAKVFTPTGACVYSGAASAPIALPAGIYIVQAGAKTAKVVL